MVGDGHAMGVAAQILQHVFGAAEGAFGVDHPVLAEQQSPPRNESFRLGEWSEVCSSSIILRSRVMGMASL
jgi:hypothetical protein